MEEIVALYPDPVSDGSSPYSANSSFGAQWNRTAAAYGDYAYISTVRGNALGVAGQMDGKAPVWKYHFNYKVPGESTRCLVSLESSFADGKADILDFA